MGQEAGSQEKSLFWNQGRRWCLSFLRASTQLFFGGKSTVCSEDQCAGNRTAECEQAKREREHGCEVHTVGCSVVQEGDWLVLEELCEAIIVPFRGESEGGGAFNYQSIINDNGRNFLFLCCPTHILYITLENHIKPQITVHFFKKESC